MRQKVQIIIIIGMVFLYGSTAYGEQETGNNSYQLETLTVTAQKREENPQKIPMSIDVLSSIAIEDAGINNTIDLTRFSPNVHMKNNYTEHVVVIRGISSFSASTYSPASLYVDDVSYSLVHMQNLELFDIERAEILKGPQGTLYGRNSESGVVNIITKQPGKHFEAKVFGEYQSYNTFRSGVNISGPLIEDRLALGGAFQYKSSDGFIKNEHNGDDQAADLEHISGRASMRWTPGDFWDITFIADFMDKDDHIGGYRFIDGPNETEPYKVRKDVSEYYNGEGNTQTLRTRFKGNNFNFLSVSSLLNYKLDRLADSDLFDNPANGRMSIFKIDQRQYSQEFRISSVRDSAFEWLVGLYGFIEETCFDFDYDMISKNKKIMHPVTDIDAKGVAAFGQGTYTLFDRLHLTAGVRFEYQDMEGHLNDGVRKENLEKDLDFTEVLPKFSTAYDISKEITAYASISRGYLTGGYNWAMKPTRDTFHYDPEYTLNYESGIKTTWMDGMLMANLSLFYIDISDKQVTEFDPKTSQKTIENAAKAHSQGVELQFKAAPVQGVNIFAGLGYTEAEFDDFTAIEWNDSHTALIENDYNGKDLPYAPRFNYNVGIQYRSGSGYFCRADLFGTDRFYGDPGNTAEQESYQTVNLRIGYEGDHYDVYLWADNVFDEEYLTYVSPYDKHTIGLDGAPGTFGIKVNYRF
ncbi:MAG: TonB-dependent receptor [Desulfobacteraceae bacterium]|nr:TonB-dependent receptor [Desulfobacteraceae bacterium]